MGWRSQRRRLSLLAFIVLMIVIWVSLEIREFKRNYTNLHRRVAEIENKLKQGGIK